MADDLCWYAGHRAVGLDTLENDTACTNARPLTDGNVSEQLSVSADKDASADFRVTIATFFPRAGQGMLHRLPTTDYRLSIAGYQLPAASCQQG